MFKKRKCFKVNNKGSLFVDVAIILPIFFLLCIFIISIFNLNITKQKVYEVLSDEARKISINEVINPISNLILKTNIKKRIVKNENYKGKNLLISKNPLIKFNYGDLIKLNANFSQNLKFMPSKIFEIKNDDYVIFRKFNGLKISNGKMPFSELEENIKSDKVYVFPRNGERYHKENCFYVKNKPVEFLFSTYIKNNYRPCKICNPVDAGLGSLVYVFVRTNKIYHLGSCSSVEKYVFPIERKEAIEEGYTACSKCGG